MPKIKQSEFVNAEAPSGLPSRPLAETLGTLRRLRDAEKWRSQVREAYARNAGVTRKPRYYYRRIVQRLRHIVPPGASVLDVGCGCGHMLAELRPSAGVGVDLVEEHIETAERLYPHLRFECMSAERVENLDRTFDYIVISQTIAEVYDVVALLKSLIPICHDRTRLVMVNYSRLWQPALRFMEWIRLKPRPAPQNWMPTDEIRNLALLSGWEPIRQVGLTIAPLRIPLISNLLNRYVANLPLMQNLTLNHIVIARPVARDKLKRRSIQSVSVVIPTRNEAGHVESLFARLPNLAPKQEIIFVEGGSTDNTWETIRDVLTAYHGPWTVRAMRQDGTGKADAVRKAFESATGDALFILDADLSVPPEELTAFRDALASGHGELINGSRMVYVMDRKAMRFLNLLGNRFFGWMFTYLLSQRFRDTLCGTKVLRRDDYQRIADNRSYFGDFDPFGDFDLLFGAARQNLKIVDVPVHYKARRYGTTNISRFRHGCVLLRMCFFAARKMKFI